MGSNTKHHQWKMLRDTSKQKESKFRVLFRFIYCNVLSIHHISMQLLILVIPIPTTSKRYWGMFVLFICNCQYKKNAILTQVYFLDTIIKVSFSKIYISFFAEHIFFSFSSMWTCITPSYSPVEVRFLIFIEVCVYLLKLPFQSEWSSL